MTTEGAVRVPLHIGRHHGRIIDSVLAADPQKLGTIFDNGSTKRWPQTDYSLVAISANTSSWGGIKKSLSNSHDFFYFIDAQVGTPVQKERIVVDTGSSDMWFVKSSYNVASSATSTLLDSKINIRYGMGAMSGIEAKDRVCVASLCVNNQSFAIAMQDSTHVGETTDGLLGLAYPALAQISGASLLANWASNGPFTYFTFALSLRHWNDAEKSSIVFGDLQDVLAEAPSGEGVTLPLLPLRNPTTSQPLPPLFWIVKTSVSIGEKHALLPAILDSGTSLIAVPPAEFAPLLYTMIPYHGLKDCIGLPGQPFLCPCGIPMQPMHFAFEGTDGSQLNISLTAEDFLLPTSTTMQRPGPKGLITTQVCMLGIFPGPPHMNFWILGDVFLRRVYAVHDVFGHQVMLFPQSGFGGQALPSVGSNGVTVAAGILAERAGQQVTALVLLFFTAVAFTFTFAACSRFHGQARVSEMGGYHHF